MQITKQASPISDYRQLTNSEKIGTSICLSLFAITETAIWQYNPGLDKQGQLIRLIGLMTIGSTVIVGIGELWDIYVNNKLPARLQKITNSEVETANDDPIAKERGQLNAKIGAAFGCALYCYDCYYNGQDNLIPLIGYVAGSATLGVVVGKVWQDCSNNSTPPLKLETNTNDLNEYLFDSLSNRRKAIEGTDNDNDEKAIWTDEVQERHHQSIHKF